MSGASMMEARRNALFSNFIAAAERRLVDNEIPPAVASIVAADLADYLADLWGGQMIYIARDYQRKLTQLELEILEAHTGHNYPELAQQYRMTESGLRRLVNRIKAKLAEARKAENVEAQLDMLEPREES